MVMTNQALLAAASAASGVTLDKPLAHGGQKLVYLADNGGCEAVVKIARVVGSPDPAALKRAHREVELLERTSHPNIVKAQSGAFDLGDPVEAVCWVEEHLDGEDLSGLVGTPWDPTAVVSMLSDVAAGIAELHRQDVIHRDLSAGNVRSTSVGYKVIDPGFAKHLDRSSITTHGQPGTPGFLSPEHVGHGTKPTAASDVFCVGVLAWLCLAGSLPRSPSDADYLNELHDQQLPSITTIHSGLTPELANVIDRCLQRQVGRRYFDGAELVDAIGALA